MLAEFTPWLAVIAVVVSVFSLRRTRQLAHRLADLEERLAERGRGTVDAAPPETPSITSQTPAVSVSDSSRTSAWDGGRKKGAALANLGDWIKANWIYPVAGAALIMAAVYLVQYSIERGLLSPQARIGLALMLGAVLIAMGEGIRRRWGDEGSSARLLPSTLSGAGIVALLAAILAAFHLYAMVSTTMALLGLAAVSALAMSLGWVHGPLLAAIGILAGAAAPFLIGGGSAPQDLLYAYLGLIAILGLGIDGFKRWGWISALAVIAPMMAGVLIYIAGAGAVGLALLALMVATLAMALPDGALIPCGAGPRVTQARSKRPSAATLISALALALSSGVLLQLQSPTVTLLSLGMLSLIVPVWTRAAPALADQIIVPVLASLGAVIVTSFTARSGVSMIFVTQPWLPLAIIVLASFSALAMIWRSRLSVGGLRDFWALIGVGYPGALIVAFELFWSLSTRSDAASWAITAMALAAGYIAIALWAAKADSGQGLLLGASAAAGLAMIAFSLMLSLSLSALTVALAVLMIVAAALDRRFNIPMVGWFLALGSMALGWRIVVNPGLSWLLGWDGSGGASDFDVILSLFASLSGPAVALVLSAGLVRNRLRDWSRVIVETGIAGLIPISLSVMIARFLFESISLHAHLGLQATVFIALAWVQMLRAEQFENSPLALVRRGLAFIFGVFAAVFIVSVTVIFSPLANSGLRADPVVGIILFNDLLLAYAVPGGLLIWSQRNRFTRGAGGARAIGVVLLIVWVACVIRHIWQGNEGMALARGIAQGELYAYTVALLIAGAAALAFALRLGRASFRFAGLALIAIAAAKAFLIDASGLTGLMRVSAFLGLGGALAVLAWLNAWVTAQMAPQQDIE